MSILKGRLQSEPKLFHEPSAWEVSLPYVDKGLANLGLIKSVPEASAQELFCQPLRGFGVNGDVELKRRAIEVRANNPCDKPGIKGVEVPLSKAYGSSYFWAPSPAEPLCSPPPDKVWGVENNGSGHGLEHCACGVRVVYCRPLEGSITCEHTQAWG